MICSKWMAKLDIVPSSASSILLLGRPWKAPLLHNIGEISQSVTYFDEWPLSYKRFDWSQTAFIWFWKRVRGTIWSRCCGYECSLIKVYAHNIGMLLCMWGKTQCVTNEAYFSLFYLLISESFHLIDICTKYGPIWVYWCYPYENMLGYIKKFVHGTKTPEKSFIFGSQVTSILPVLERFEFKKLARNLTEDKLKVLTLVLSILFLSWFLKKML